MGDGEGLETLDCAVCAAKESDGILLYADFQVDPESKQPIERFLCQHCLEKQQTESVWVVWCLCGAAATCGLALMRSTPIIQEQVVATALMIPFLAKLVTLLSIVFHELGHALMCLALGVSVKQVSLGQGPVLKRWRWFETDWVLHSLPMGGCAYHEPIRSNRIMVAVAMMGPFTNFILAAICFVLAGGFSGLRELPESGWALLFVVAFWANGCLFVVCCLPYEGQRDGRLVRSDGFAVMRGLFPSLAESERIGDKGAGVVGGLASLVGIFAIMVGIINIDAFFLGLGLASLQVLRVLSGAGA